MKISRIKTFFITVLLFGLVSLPFFAFSAQGPDCVKDGTICNPINAKSINEVIKKILEGVIKIGIPIIALMIIYCGFLFVSARGNSKELETAKRSLTYTLIGAAILLGSWAIAQLISDTVLKL